MKRFLLATAALLLLAVGSTPAGDKASPWKPILPADVYKVLTERSVKAIEDLAASDDKEAKTKIEAEAALLAGCTLSVKNANDDAVVNLRRWALAARGRDLKDLRDFGKLTKTKPPAEVKDAKLGLQDLNDMMTPLFRGKSKGGDGIHADLQYLPKLKNLNGGEALIGALANKKLNAENADKLSKELPLFAYRVAVAGSLTHEFAKQKGAAQWHEYANLMRDSSVALADAAAKKNADGILKAATSLESSCIQCHGAFRGK